MSNGNWYATPRNGKWVCALGDETPPRVHRGPQGRMSVYRSREAAEKTAEWLNWGDDLLGHPAADAGRLAYINHCDDTGGPSRRTVSGRAWLAGWTAAKTTRQRRNPLRPILETAIAAAKSNPDVDFVMAASRLSRRQAKEIIHRIRP